MAENSSELRHKTQVTNQYIANKHVIPAMGSIPISEISPMLIEDFYRFLMSERGLSPSTVHRVHAFLNVPLAMAARYGMISANPLELVKKPKRSQVRISIFTAVEIDRILSVAARGDAREYLRWVLAIHYGLRQGEALALTRNDFDRTRLTLTVDKQVQPIAGKGFIVTPPKSEKGNRTLPVDPNTATLFKRALAEMNFGEVLLFPGNTASHRHASTDRKNWVKMLRDADVRYLPLHSARHTAATNLVQRGVDTRTVQLALGHSSPSFTLSTYVHPDLLGLPEPLFQIHLPEQVAQ
jgi:integrase